MSSGIYNKYTGYHNRRSIRLRGYDYSRSGYYFVTICIHDRKQNLFVETTNVPGLVGACSKPAPFAPAYSPQHAATLPTIFTPNQYGEIVRNTWNDLPNHIPKIALDEFVIMPNHVPGIIRIIAADLEQRAGLEHHTSSSNAGNRLFCTSITLSPCFSAVSVIVLIVISFGTGVLLMVSGLSLRCYDNWCGLMAIVIAHARESIERRKLLQ